MSKARPITLAPLKFKEAVADLLKVKPPPKKQKLEPIQKKRQQTGKN